jgi:hypothetical protein
MRLRDPVFKAKRINMYTVRSRKTPRKRYIALINLKPLKIRTIKVRVEDTSMKIRVAVQSMMIITEKATRKVAVRNLCQSLIRLPA